MQNEWFAVWVWSHEAREKTFNNIKIEHVSLSDEGPLLKTLEFFAISHGICQHLDIQ